MMLPLIDLPELKKIFQACVIIDASWIYGPLNAAGIDPRAEYNKKHIRDAWFLDMADLAKETPQANPHVDVIPPLPHGTLQGLMRTAGAECDAPVVVTDMDGGFTTAPFARYNLLEAGFTNVRILNGGTPGCAAEEGILTSQGSRYLDASTHLQKNGDEDHAPGLPVFAGYDEYMQAYESSAFVTLDCRVDKSNNGFLPEKYKNLRIPADKECSPLNLIEETPYGGRFKNPDALRYVFENLNMTGNDHIVTACYFGFSACVVATAMEQAGYGNVSVYPGSLIDYAQKRGLVASP